MNSPIKSFVLRSGRMSRAQERSYEGGSPFLIPYTGRETDLSPFFENKNPLTVEIGFGMGRATAEIAAANPQKNYLGIEVFKAGVGKLLWEIEQRKLSNIRIIEHDAVEVLDRMIPPASARLPTEARLPVEAVHIFFPDPWPKKRHHKRRLIQRPFGELLASRLRKGGYIYMVTDWEDYGREALEVLSSLPSLTNPYESFAPRMEWRPRTKFEERGLDKNHRIWEIYLTKNK